MKSQISQIKPQWFGSLEPSIQISFLSRKLLYIDFVYLLLIITSMFKELHNHLSGCWQQFHDVPRWLIITAILVTLKYGNFIGLYCILILWVCKKGFYKIQHLWMLFAHSSYGWGSPCSKHDASQASSQDPNFGHVWKNKLGVGRRRTGSTGQSPRLLHKG